ncbi:hypothetical protein GCG21_03240 [Pseudactinotalea sp. HY160]|uniref:hypothetical protein n=1 Tax=Pseudactinotalea sp. HY160 TaxID=2654490 RepID=UPI00128D4893|nr:hypothetical protein [Pseudactinotalea sp. HY160]MPV49037.1 hypothetical protein [Pseudactinotalea sp. HY160]
MIHLLGVYGILTDARAALTLARPRRCAAHSPPAQARAERRVMIEQAERDAVTPVRWADSKAPGAPSTPSRVDGM